MMSLVLSLAASVQAADWPDLSEPAASTGGGIDDAAVIIAIEDYAVLPDVPGAVQAGEAWATWLTETRGVPKDNVLKLTNEKANEEWLVEGLRGVGQRVGTTGTVWVVFVGHGYPAEDGSDGLLVGFDARPEVLRRRSVPLLEVQDLVTRGNQATIVAIVDGRFDGRSHTGVPLVPEAELVIPKQLEAGSRVSLLWGADAGALPGDDLPALSALALGGLRGWADLDGDGSVALSELPGWIGSTLGTLEAPATPVFAGTDRTFQTAKEAAPPFATLLAGQQPVPELELVPDTVDEVAPPQPAEEEPGDVASDLDPVAACDAGEVSACQSLADSAAEDQRSPIFEKACIAGIGSFCAKRADELIDDDPVAALGWLRRACDAGDFAACGQVGAIYDTGLGNIVASPARAVEYSRVACEPEGEYPGDVAACGVVGYYRAVGIGTAYDRVEGVKQLEAACEADHLPSCGRLAPILYEAGSDDARAHTLARLGCAAEQPVACWTLAETLRSGRGTTADVSAWKQVLVDNCKRDHGPSCAALGKKYPTESWAAHACGLGFAPACASTGLAALERSAKGAFESLQAGCAGGAPNACRGVALVYERGKAGRSVDEAKALSVYDRACDLGDDWACVWRGWMQRDGRGVSKRDFAGAAVDYKRGCDVSGTESCHNLANHLRKEGHIEDSVALFDQACKLGSSYACANLGVWLVDPAEPTDPMRGTMLLRNACDARNKRACAVLGTTLVDGAAGVDVDVLSGHRFLAKACELGDGASCGEAGFLFMAGQTSRPDPYKAYKAFQKGCGLDDGQACEGEAELLVLGEGAPKDLAKARAIAAKACDHGRDQGCFRAAHLSLTDNKRIREEDGGALHTLGEVCERKHAASCLVLADFHEVGRWPLDKKSKKDAKEFRAKACAAGEQAACK